MGSIFTPSGFDRGVADGREVANVFDALKAWSILLRRQGEDSSALASSPGIRDMERFACDGERASLVNHRRRRVLMSIGSAEEGDSGWPR